MPLAEDDWELPSEVVPLFVDERVGDDNTELPEANEVKNCDEMVVFLSDNPTFEASPSEFIWPLYNEKPSQRCSGLDPHIGIGSTNVNLWV